ncbi:MAG: glycosyltransferase family 2 protein [Opitutae bacterium]|nr:glycosyltransferase family 2 protein [Opitutae bacterium]
MESLSVFYIIKNEEKRLPESLEKASQIADEIIVVDSGSTDRSIEIAESFGAKVSFKEWKGYAVQKAHAASLCKNNWLLNLDADEVLSDEVILSIKETLKSKDLEEYGGFEMRWKHVPPIEGHPLKYISDQYILRLYNKNKAGFKVEANSIEDRASIKQGKSSKLRGVVYHKCILSFDQLEKKYSLMSSDQAHYFFNKKRKISNLRLYLEFPLKFFKYFFVVGLCRNGWYGFSLSIVAAYRNFMRFAKARELQINQELEKKEKSD